MDRLPVLTPRQYQRVALFALGSLVLIVFTGAAVRLTGSGLGCPDWPKCYGRVVAPVELHALIEYGNRLLTGVVGAAVIAASLLAFRRRPFRRHLAILGGLLPLGVVAQAALGAAVVASHLRPELVMLHFILSMALIDAAFALGWLSRYEPGERGRSGDRGGVWAVRGLVGFGQLTIILGTMSTAAGPHPGDHQGELVQRFDFRGAETLEWLVQRHSVAASMFGLAAVGTWLLLRRDGGDDRAVRPLTALIALLGLQGAVGGVQWLAELPAEIVWVHIVLATLSWIAMLWAVATAGRIEPVTVAAKTAPIGGVPDPRSGR